MIRTPKNATCAYSKTQMQQPLGHNHLVEKAKSLSKWRLIGLNKKGLIKAESNLLLEEVALSNQLLYLNRRPKHRGGLPQSQSRVHLVLIQMVQDRELIGEELACHTLISCHQQITLRKILNLCLQLLELLK